MADLSITASDVITVSGGTYETGIAGVAITAGQVVYKDTADSNKLKLADNDNASSVVRTPAGIALNAAAAGQPVRFQKAGGLDLGATLTVGQTYCLSSTAGGICPIADIATGDDLCYLGYATAADNLRMMLNVTGVTRA